MVTTSRSDSHPIMLMKTAGKIWSISGTWDMRETGGTGEKYVVTNALIGLKRPGWDQLSDELLMRSTGPILIS